MRPWCIAQTTDGFQYNRRISIDQARRKPRRKKKSNKTVKRSSKEQPGVYPPSRDLLDYRSFIGTFIPVLCTDEFPFLVRSTGRVHQVSYSFAKHHRPTSHACKITGLSNDPRLLSRLCLRVSKPPNKRDKLEIRVQVPSNLFPPFIQTDSLIACLS